MRIDGSESIETDEERTSTSETARSTDVVGHRVHPRRPRPRRPPEALDGVGAFGHRSTTSQASARPATTTLWDRS